MNPVIPNRHGRELLRVADAIYIGFNESLEALFSTFSSDELDLIEETAHEFTETNCGWSEYHLVHSEAYRNAVLRRRQTLNKLAERERELAATE